MTKYCADSSYGIVDNKIVLDLEDDAAYVNMGTEWRMPTYDEQVELLTKCTWTWTTQDGVNGHKVTGPNGKSIFLPAAGLRFDGDLSETGSNGNFRSASLIGRYPYYAWSLSFNFSSPTTYQHGRHYGLPVRAVAR
jgi:hypothetical protein